jgi:hypothetical protein
MRNGFRENGIDVWRKTLLLMSYNFFSMLS